jgi:hypothetical protein
MITNITTELEYGAGRHIIHSVIPTLTSHQAIQVALIEAARTMSEYAPSKPVAIVVRVG